MTVTAPPRPPERRDPVERDEIEALIEEARQRTRRRRRTYVALTAVLVLIGVSLFIVFGRPGPSLSASSGLPTPAGAPDQDEAATLIAHYQILHWGWVLAYADGRVIWQFRGHEYDNNVSDLFERRLTPDGADLVRSGAIQPSTLLDEASSFSSCAEGEEVCPSVPSALPAGTWADSEIGTYEPSRWTAGALSEPEISRFPAAAQALLRGRKTITYNNVGLFYDDKTPSGDMFELTTAEVSALRAALIDAGIPEVSATDANLLHGYTPFVSPGRISLGQGLELHISPILPHGEPIAWLG